MGLQVSERFTACWGMWSEATQLQGPSESTCFGGCTNFPDIKEETIFTLLLVFSYHC